jgi:predicted DCC family thiol-disulfide oxidoreductase YuxK
MITAIFDGRCAICQTTRTIIKGLDWFRRVEFLDLHNTSEVIKRFPQLDPGDLMGQIHVIDANQHVYAGFDGTRRMLRDVPLGFPVWLLLHLPGMHHVGVRVYGWIARHRYAVNRFFGVELSDDNGCEDGVCKLPQ